MNKQIRRFSFLMAFVIAFIFQIAVSLDYHNRGIRFNEKKLEALTTALKKDGDESDRLRRLDHWDTDNDDGIVFLNSEGKVLYSNSLSKKTEAMVDRKSVV